MGLPPGEVDASETAVVKSERSGEFRSELASD